MSKHFLYNCYLIFVVLLIGSCSQKSPYHINGDVGKDIKYIAVKYRKSNPSSSSYKRHRIIDGKVSLSLDLDSNKVYETDLWINEGSYSPCVFFADGKDISLKKVDSALRRWAVVSDSPQNMAYQGFLEDMDKFITSSGIRDSIKKANELLDDIYTPEYLELQNRCFSDTITADSRTAIIKEMETMQKDGRAWSVAGQRYNSIWKEYYILKEEYYKSHIQDIPFGLASFNVLVEAMENAQSNNLDLGYWLAYYQNEYANKFPDCNLHYNAMDVIGKSSMVAGKHYVDFSLPDDKGQIQTVSQLIEGKVAVIDLWASWCGPCIKKLREMKPLYEKYKDAGFVIISAAREDVNDRAWKSIIAKEKFPWVNMIDMDPWHPIWNTYGYANGSGTTFLFGTDGLLIKIDPSIQDIEDAIKASQK